MAQTSPPSGAQSVFNKLGATALIALMVFAALMLWLGIPLGWLVIGSLLVSSSQPSMGPYMVVIIGIIVSVVITANLISRINRAYERVSGNQGRVRVQLPWMKSMRGEREAPKERSVLDVVMVGSVILAAAAAGAWFFLLAGSSLPGG